MSFTTLAPRLAPRLAKCARAMPPIANINALSGWLFALAVAGPVSGVAAAADSAAGKGAAPFWQDTAFWVLVPFAIVVYVLVSKGAPKLVSNALDTKSREIREELETARALKEEAQELLANAQRQQNDAEAEAAGFIAQAREDAKRLAEEIRIRMEEQLARRVKAAEQKIARAEAQAITDIRHQTIELAMAAAEQVITDRLDDDQQGRLIDDAISRLGPVVN